MAPRLGTIDLCMCYRYRQVAHGSTEDVSGRTKWHHDLAENELEIDETQPIEHSESAPEIADDEAAHFAAEQLAGYIERNVAAFMPAAANRLHGAKIEAIMPDDDMDLDGDESQDIVYVKLNHNRKQLRHELSTGVSLKLCPC